MFNNLLLFCFMFYNMKKNILPKLNLLQEYIEDLPEKNMTNNKSYNNIINNINENNLYYEDCKFKNEKDLITYIYKKFLWYGKHETCDENNKHKQETIEEFIKTAKNNNAKELLDKLEDTTNSLNKKIEEIEKYNDYYSFNFSKFNIFNGGLFNDFDFDFDNDIDYDNKNFFQ